jgi:hypothetical protein
MYNSDRMPIPERQSSTSPWLLLVFSLPRNGASLRVAVWRKLQRYGSLPLGNSGYLLPNSGGNREKFEWLATTIRGAQGEASVLEVKAIDNCSKPQLMKRFSDARTQEYRGDIAMLEGEVTPVLKTLRKNGIDVVAIHHHMTGEQPMVVFLHYWGRGPAGKLANGFKAALDQLGNGSAHDHGGGK